MLEKLLRVGFNAIRIILIKIRLRNRVQIPIIQPMRVRSQLMIQKGALQVHIGRRFKLETDAKVRVINGGQLYIGENCFINCNSYITVLGKTKIGNNCLIGPGVMIFDHDHDYKAEGGVSSGKMICGTIEIGNNVWIGANTLILKGSKIGDNAVIGAGSIINFEVKENSVCVQKRHSDFYTKDIEGNLVKEI